MAYSRRFALASRKYRPDVVRLLFIAESPPAFHANRFFYFTDLTNGDTLFLEMMKSLYPERVGFSGSDFKPGFSSRLIRSRKAELLDRFRRDGFYLIDAYDQPMPEDASDAVKTALIRTTLPQLRRRVKRLCGNETEGIVLIGGPAYRVCADALKASGLNVLNTGMINHPSRGGQVLFRSKLSEVMARLRGLEVRSP